MQLWGHCVNRRAHHLWTSLDMHLLRWSAGGMECPQLRGRPSAGNIGLQNLLCWRSSNQCWFWRQDEDEDEDSTDKPAQGGAAGVLQNMQQKVAGVGQVRTARWSCTNTVGDAIGKRHMLMIEAGRTHQCWHLSDSERCSWQDVLQKTAAAAGPLLSKAKEGVAAAFSKFKPAAQSEPPKVEL
jgi:hypothetical protein